MVEFNINNYVFVRLTKQGRERLIQTHNRIQQLITDRGGSAYPYREPEEDAEGWSRWQLWDLMKELGSACGNGIPVPFETTIRIDVVLLPSS